jgi:hypothetical protein
MQVAIRVRPSLPREYKVVLGTKVAFDVLAFAPRFYANHDNWLRANSCKTRRWWISSAGLSRCQKTYAPPSRAATPAPLMLTMAW